MPFVNAWIPGAPVALPAFPELVFRVSRVYRDLLEIEVWVEKSVRPDIMPDNSWASFGSVRPEEEGALRPLPWAPITPYLRRRLREKAAAR